MILVHLQKMWYCHSIAATEHRSSQSLVVAAPHKHPPTHALNSDAVAVRWDADVTWCQPRSKIGLFQRFSTAIIRQLSFFTLCRMEQLSQLTRREAEFTCFFWEVLWSSAEDHPSCSADLHQSVVKCQPFKDRYDWWIRGNQLDNCDIPMCVSMDLYSIHGFDTFITWLHQSLTTLKTTKQRTCFGRVFCKFSEVWTDGAVLVRESGPKWEVNLLQCDMPLSKAEV